MSELSEDRLRSHLGQTLREDSVKEDATTRSLPGGEKIISGEFLAKDGGILSGRQLVNLTFQMLAEMDDFPGRTPELNWSYGDGDSLEADTHLADIKGPASTILSGERIALNYVQQLSGVASLTGELVTLAKPYGVDVYDTRKTVPHLRFLQKYAVRCGGGRNHRMDLSEAVMIKDNHKQLAGGLEDYLETLRTDRPVILEIHDREELRTLSSLLSSRRYTFDIEVVMLDNFSPTTIEESLEIIPNSIEVEASGGIDENTIQSYCEAGPDRVSVGALTHSFDSLDVSLNLTSLPKS
ncbi:MAG: carboxylating nicotinate-nucleotide diphosphorylase [bacterium]